MNKHFTTEDLQWPISMWKSAQHLSSGKCKLLLQWQDTSHPQSGSPQKDQQPRLHVGQPEFSHFAGVNANGTSTLGKCLPVFYQVNYTLSCSIPRYSSKYLQKGLQQIFKAVYSQWPKLRKPQSLQTEEWFNELWSINTMELRNKKGWTTSRWHNMDTSHRGSERSWIQTSAHFMIPFIWRLR